ncbi:MAG TPA: gluconokinase, GntK/IdnK-type, partial [Chitinophagaceae bacterium]|nr:gluconokinase, GntK/IdnK-type [Chitinophagaceae bacterium]
MRGRVIIVTGVSGSGKTTVGTALAQRMGGEFHDGDHFHQPANVAKMSSGIPLNDEDREPWLKAINRFIRERTVSTPVVIACSALKEKYRKTLTENLDPTAVQWVHLQGSYDVIYRRMHERKEHFMSAEMLRSQFDAYEQPIGGIAVSVDQTLDQIIDEIVLMISTEKSDVGLIGLGVMGTSLARNIASRGFSISIFNRHVPGKEEAVAIKMATEFPELAQAKPFDDLQAFVESIQPPRKIILMVNAGKAVDDVINNIRPFLQPGDTIVDGGNSFYRDTDTRVKTLAGQGIHFVGSGVSGGEEGALRGPSIMPGGSEAGWELVKPVLNSIAAKNHQGEVCCGFIGKGGAGHFVKMVHNGIEYGLMQLIAETYEVLRNGLQLKNDQIQAVFEKWNEGRLQSCL